MIDLLIRRLEMMSEFVAAVHLIFYYYYYSFKSQPRDIHVAKIFDFTSAMYFNKQVLQVTERNITEAKITLHFYRYGLL